MLKSRIQQVYTILALWTAARITALNFMLRNDNETANIPCSQFLCLDHMYDSSNCSSFDECQCFSWNNPMFCPNFDKEPLDFFFEPASKHFALSGRRVKQDFDTAIQYIAKFLVAFDWNILELDYFCKPGVPMSALKDIKYFLTISESDMSILNVSRFPVIDRPVAKLMLKNSCIRNLTGSFASTFRRVKKIDLARNLLMNITNETFAGLLDLDELHLQFNQIQNISQSAFQDLTSLTRLSLADNKIYHLPSGLFKYLINLNEVDLFSNRLQKLSANTFSYNVQLKYIRLCHNEIELIPPDLLRKLFKLLHFDASYNKLTALPAMLFSGLINLQDVKLNDNKLSYVPSSQFKTNTALRHVDLSQNCLMQLPDLTFIMSLDKLPTLNVSHNQISSLAIPLVPHIMQAESVDISGNRIHSYNESRGSVSPLNKTFFIEELRCRNCSLKTIRPKLLQGVTRMADFKYNLVTKLDMELLKSIAHLEKVDLDSNNISIIELNWSYPLVQDNSSTHPLDNPTTEIIIKNNRFNCNCQVFTLLQFLDINYQLPHGLNKSSLQFDLTEVICEKPITLRGVLVKYLSLDKELLARLVCDVTSACPAVCHCYYVPYHDSTVVNCSGLQLSEFPELPAGLATKNLAIHLEENLLQYLPNQEKAVWNAIQQLYLDNNHINSLEGFQLPSKLVLLHLKNNRLTDFQQPLQILLESRPNISLTLSGNPWVCNCDMLKIRSLVFTSGAVVDSKSLTCLQYGLEQPLLVANAKDYELCPALLDSQNLLRILLPFFAGITIIISVCLVLLYRYTEEFKLWLFQHGLCLRFIAEEDIDGDKIYDAFVSYSSFDEEWVGHELVPELEQGNPGYKLCIHNRDWLVGEWIPEQIFRSVQGSRRTIIVLTEHFVESVWSRLEFHAAYQQALTDHVNRVLIVVPDEIPNTENLDHELRAFISLNTYIKWKDPHFWRKLRCAMPKTIPISQKQHSDNNNHIDAHFMT